MAIFKRKRSKSFPRAAKDLLWPAMGWKRTSYYYFHRIFRTGDSVYKINAGFASGVAVSFTPLLGTHLLQAFLLSKLLKANITAGLTGTLVGNPWTFPLFFYVAYSAGTYFLSLLGIMDDIGAQEQATFTLLLSDPSAFWDFLLEKPLGFFLPLLTGGYICAALAWIGSYFILYHPFRILHRIYRRRRIAKYKKKRKAS